MTGFNGGMVVALASSEQPAIRSFATALDQTSATTTSGNDSLHQQDSNGDDVDGMLVQDGCLVDKYVAACDAQLSDLRHFATEQEQDDDGYLWTLERQTWLLLKDILRWASDTI